MKQRHKPIALGYTIGTTLGLLALSFLPGCDTANRPLAAEKQVIMEWRTQRVQNLTRDTGWLSLAGLFWLHAGNNSFGRAADNDLALDHPALADTLGVFHLQDQHVTFSANSNVVVTTSGNAVTNIALTPDKAGAPTVLASGSLQFYAIERVGRYGIRVRDTESPTRKQFAGLNYYPIDMTWRVNAHFIPYQPAKQIAIVNILGMTENMISPGAIEFDRAGQTWRLDTLLESPGDQELFVMFKDATNGEFTYGAGRFMYIAMPQHDRVWVDFNQAYNPPCAFTEFATCPLPPKQNRLSLAVTAGEMKYVKH